MTLEEIIKKITEFLKGIYRSEKFAERLISVLIGLVFTRLILLFFGETDSPFPFIDYWWSGYYFTWEYFFKSSIIFVPMYFVSRTLYRFIIKRLGS
tara:strand:- start:396 stop:683 length:288 start_codon:yes stop_codon:yes gene_type:complete